MVRIRNQYKNPSGIKESFNEDGILRETIKEKIKNLYELSGFIPMETSILNYSELLSSKYGGGAEILKEMYTLSDQGDRDLALRYDLTVPFIKYMAMNPSLQFPVKRYETGKVFRNGPVKKGRLREFTQCDADILGVKDIMAESELLIVVTDILESLGLKVRVEINNIKIIKGLLSYMKIEESLYKGIILTLDKKLKITEDEMLNELASKGLANDESAYLLKKLNEASLKGVDYLGTIGDADIIEGIAEVNQLKNYVGKDNVIINPYLARGLEIYTGSIYEVFIEDNEVTSSVASGGRYDEVIGTMLEGKLDVPAVGISIGLDVVMAALSDEVLRRNILSGNDVDYYIIPLGTEKECLSLAGLLRTLGKKVEVEMIKKKLGKALSKASSSGYRKVLILGENELNDGCVVIKDLEKVLEEKVEIEDLLRRK